MGEELSVTEFSNIQKGENGTQTVSDTRMGCLSFNVQSCLLKFMGLCVRQVHREDCEAW